MARVIPALDIYRAANLLVKHHGEDASIHAAMRADAMLETGDLDGYAAWRRILRAAEELQGTEPAPQGTGALSPVLAGTFLSPDSSTTRITSG